MKASEAKKLRDIKGRLQAVRRSHPDPFEKRKGNLAYVSVAVFEEQEWLLEKVRTLLIRKKAELSAEEMDRLRTAEGRLKTIRRNNRDEFERKSFVRSVPVQVFLDSGWLAAFYERADAGPVESDDEPEAEEEFEAEEAVG